MTWVCCKICFVAIYAVLSRNLFCRDLRASCVEKNWTKNCACGEKRQISGMLQMHPFPIIWGAHSDMTKYSKVADVFASLLLWFCFEKLQFLKRKVSYFCRRIEFSVSIELISNFCFVLSQRSQFNNPAVSFVALQIDLHQ